MILIEEFHWLPQDIDKIPKKWIELFFIVRKAKNNAQLVMQEREEFLQAQKSGGSRGKSGKKVVTRKII